MLTAACTFAEMDNIYNCAKGALDIIQDGKECTQSVYDITQYVETFDDTSYYTRENGNFAGKIYQAS